MLGKDFPTVGWPACGEIDVVENNGDQPDWVQGSLHSNSGNVTARYYFTSPDSVTNWHIYDLVWSSGEIRWLVDGRLYETQSMGVPFNAPFFFILNLAVGGTYVGNPAVAQIEAGTTFPAEMLVDYVRVYGQTAPMALSVSA